MGGFHPFKRSSKETSDSIKPISQEEDTPLHPVLLIGSGLRDASKDSRSLSFHIKCRSARESISRCLSTFIPPFLIFGCNTQIFKIPLLCNAISVIARKPARKEAGSANGMCFRIL